VGNDRVTRVDAGSLISARGDLKMVAAEDLTNKGRISSGGDLTVKAGGDINLVAVQDRTVTVEGLTAGCVPKKP
jgi:filamentous hemagglutinin